MGPSEEIVAAKETAVSPGEIVGYTIGLVVVAGVTAGFWLNLIMWIPMLVIGRMRDEALAFTLVSLLSMAAAAVTVFLVGVLAVGLPWYAALIAGLLIGITSYARPNPAHA
jgi:hypothetical protein